ncbi:receptor homology region, transmembrane domain- and RING domain-containing protein 1 [Populus nigra]|uniref:receptor homology region, transmembrane domain- and RING domain-containing protein 1 n=1 Tax=Populus nigra TaxID=3691 RepID=UPI002B277849|nr:receptor homology region, transmembrane domain- and RING domain-containing protein 1 [Populus nigra]
MREGLFLILSLFYAIMIIEGSSATVLIKPSSISFPDLPAKSALSLNGSRVCGSLHVANPLDACSPLRNRFEFNESGRFALIVRGECAFEDKIKNAQSAGFRAAIVFDDKDNRNLIYMMVNPEGIKVHAVFVSKYAGEILKERARGKEGECCINSSRTDAAWTVLAISLISVVVILGLLIIVFVTPRHWLHWQRTNNCCKSVDSKMVEALPCFTFRNASLSQCHVGETCAICLEDYKDGEVLKVLPCQHEFHSTCVDSWLTKWGTFCPVCKLDMKDKSAYFGILKLNKIQFALILGKILDRIDQEVNPASESVNTSGSLPSFDNQNFHGSSFAVSNQGHDGLICTVLIGRRVKDGALLRKKRVRSTIFNLHRHELVFMGSLDKSTGAEVVTVDVKATKGLLESGYTYLDVRTVEEYNKGHVDGEKIFNIPYLFNTPEGRVKNPNFLKEVSGVCKEEDKLLVGCQSGVRSLYATADLLSAGFKDVSNVGGGYLAWTENVFPVKIEKAERDEL